MHTQSPSDTHSVYTGFVRSSCSQSYRLHNPLQTMSGEKQRSHPQKHSCQTHMVTPAAPSLSPSPPTQTDTSIVVLYKTLNSTKGFWHYHCFLFIYLFFILQFCDGSLRKDMSSRISPWYLQRAAEVSQICSGFLISKWSCYVCPYFLSFTVTLTDADL